MGLLGLLSILHSAFFGDQVGCRESRSGISVSRQPAGVLIVGTAAPGTGEDTWLELADLGRGSFIVALETVAKETA